MDLPPSLSFCLFFLPLEVLIVVVLQLEEQGFPHLSFMSSPQREHGFIFLPPPSSSGAITQHCSPNHDRHEGCVLVRQSQRGFAIPALLANSCGLVDGPPSLFWMVILITLVSAAAVLFDR